VNVGRSKQDGSVRVYRTGSQRKKTIRWSDRYKLTKGLVPVIIEESVCRIGVCRRTREDKEDDRWDRWKEEDVGRPRRRIRVSDRELMKEEDEDLVYK